MHLNLELNLSHSKDQTIFSPKLNDFLLKLYNLWLLNRWKTAKAYLESLRRPFPLLYFLSSRMLTCADKLIYIFSFFYRTTTKSKVAWHSKGTKIFTVTSWETSREIPAATCSAHFQVTSKFKPDFAFLRSQKQFNKKKGFLIISRGK